MQEVEQRMEQLPRGGNKQISFAKCFCLISKGNKNKEKRIYFNLSSPNPLGNCSCIALLTYIRVGIQQERAFYPEQLQ